MASCSGPRRKPCSPSPLIPNPGVPRSAFSPYFTLGARTCSITPTCIVWSPAVVSLPTAANGFPAGMDFSYPWACYPVCFVVCFWNIWSKPLTRPNCSFSPRSNYSGTGLHSWITWLPCARPNGWSTRRGLSPDPSRCWTTSGAYTHRVAISNNRLLDIAEGKVTFRYKDYRHEAQQKTMTLEAEEFIRRFLLHVLPQGFQRIRYYGFLANRYREQKLARRRELLDMPAPEPPALEGAKDYRERYAELIGPSLRECPVCHKGRMLVIEILPRSPHRKMAITDTS